MSNLPEENVPLLIPLTIALVAGVVCLVMYALELLNCVLDLIKKIFKDRSYSDH